MLDALDLAVAIVALVGGALIARDPSNMRWRQTVALAAACLVLHTALLELPRYVPELRVFGGSWNWSGKVFALAGSLLFVPLVDAADRRRWLRMPAWDPVVYLGVAAVAILAFVGPLAFADSMPFSAETLAFQLTMPTLDEELFYRGVLLSLLVHATGSRTAPIWITGLLFGLAHVSVADFDMLTFLRTFGFGLACAWLTVRSDGSLLPAAFLHSMTNTLLFLAQMI
jgi:membrane protease YdiL (CAAX protease family)